MKFKDDKPLDEELLESSRMRFPRFFGEFLEEKKQDPREKNMKVLVEEFPELKKEIEDSIQPEKDGGGKDSFELEDFI